MGASTIPAAGGGSSANSWTYIAAATPSAAATASFTGISGYSQLKIVAYLTASTYGNFYVQFNSDTANNYYGGAWGVSNYMSTTVTASVSSNGISLTSSGPSTASFSFEVDNANSTSAYKDINGASIAQGVPNFGYQNYGVWRSTSAITSLQIGNYGSSATITGNIYLLGRN